MSRAVASLTRRSLVPPPEGALAGPQRFARVLRGRELRRIRVNAAWKGEGLSPAWSPDGAGGVRIGEAGQAVGAHALGEFQQLGLHLLLLACGQHSAVGLRVQPIAGGLGCLID